jgi:2-keto-4-pentenoate hydratase/2-oxohepta-3-ene-1,7-dioic acid hydratase in catechol pathway
VIKTLTTRATVEQAADAILGFAPLVSVRDMRLPNAVIEPASMQEHSLPHVYARWGDGTNLIGTPVDTSVPSGAKCSVEIDGGGSVQGSIDEYIYDTAHVITFMSQYITLFPGDVLTLGRLAQIVELDMTSPAAYSGRASIDGIGTFEFRLEMR